MKEKMKSWKVIPSRQSPELKEFLENEKSKFPWVRNNGEFLYCWQNNIFEEPKCKLEDCNNSSRFVSSIIGYKDGCSKTHNTILTNRKKYGVDNVFQNKDVQKKHKNTIKEKYGTEQYFQSNDFKSKVNLVEQGRKLIQNQKQHNFKKYGKEFLFQVSEIQDKIKLSNLKKYGSKTPLTHSKIIEKTKKTNLLKYSAEHHFTNETIKDKIKKTNLLKYGAANPSQSESLKQERYRLTYYDKIKKIPELKLLCDVKDFNGVYSDITYDWQCKACSTTFEQSLENGKIPQCPKCYPHKRSTMELDFISECLNNLKFSQNLRPFTFDNGNQFELDFIIENKLAIELNGNYWHSDLHGNKDKNYHLKKTTKCEENNLQLIHIFEDEWIFKRKIVKSIINAKLGKFNNRIYARKTTIKEINSTMKNQFLEENHLQGVDKSSITIGLFYNNELVSVMTFGNSRYNKKYQYEMHRFCNKLGYQIVGGASKLFKYFTNVYNPKSIITYADRRYSDGTFYEKIGFTKLGVSTPNFFILGKNKLKRLSRHQFQKHLLKDKLNNFNSEISAWENLQMNGYDRIWDCGNHKFEWISTSL
ncbi:MAG: hypothetical protein U9Q83_00235 [Bacteroidota bacterium]|nr:hypothetical protein [Bacteroidota bacterium]